MGRQQAGKEQTLHKKLNIPNHEKIDQKHKAVIERSRKITKAHSAPNKSKSLKNKKIAEPVSNKSQSKESKKEIRKTGFPLTQDLVDRELSILGGTIE